jgi:hypothetical protein
MTRYRVGVDIGGTFTDIVFLGHTGERLTRAVVCVLGSFSPMSGSPRGRSLTSGARWICS